MPAYMIITARITDAARFIEYAKQAAALVQEMGGQYLLVRPRQAETLEGDWDEEEKLVISRWPDAETARAFWNSDRYRDIKRLRDGAAKVTVRLYDMG